MLKIIAPDFDNENHLSDISPSDKPWDIHRAEVDHVEDFYSQAVEFEKYALRLSDCSGLLKFAHTEVNLKSVFKLKTAFFCRVRYCPVCQWRRSLMWRAKMFQALPKVIEDYKGARWVFLTLTIRNCEITDLRETITSMNRAWNNFVKRTEFKSVLGWVRTTEVTTGKDGVNMAHPHFHCLLMVKPSYFTGASYVKQARWAEMWKETNKLTYTPVIHVKTVKNTVNGDDLNRAICETLKYSVKPADLIADKDWFLELTKQTHKLRFIATGGILKDVFKNLERPTNEEMIHLSEGDTSTDDVKALIAFGYNKEKKRYTHVPKYDEFPT